MSKKVKIMKVKFFVKIAALHIYGLLLCCRAPVVLADKYTYTSQERRDPFVPLITPEGYLLNLEPEDDSKIRLEGIIYDSKGDSMAIINGALIKVGESVGDVVVAKIESDSVTVIKDNENIELEFRREE